MNGAGSKALLMPADIGNPNDVNGLVERVQARFGRVDILLNNAAVLAPVGPTVTVDMEEWAYAIQVNVVAPMRLTRLVLPGMLERRSGHIVNVSSGVASGHTSMLGANAYTTSKAALEAHTLNLAAELAGTGIKVNVLRPGTVDTAMQTWMRTQPGEQIGHELREKFVGYHAEGRLAHPYLPAKVIADLVSGETTGQIVEAPLHF
jgi:3-oxoacyl-[acyl-carrier protein] reductase